MSNVAACGEDGEDDVQSHAAKQDAAHRLCAPVLNPQHRQRPRVSVARADPANAAHCRLAAKGSADAQLVNDTYLPGGMSEADAARWLKTVESSCWVVEKVADEEDGDDDSAAIPIGMIAFHETGGAAGTVAVPADSVEIEWWVLASHRGRGLMDEAFKAVISGSDFSFPYSHAVAVIWKTNDPARRHAAKSGYTLAGETWYQDADSEGLCEVWVLPIGMKPEGEQVQSAAAAAAATAVAGASAGEKSE